MMAAAAATCYEPGDLYRFLKRFKTIKRSNFTHTSITRPAGSYFIPPEHRPTFFSLYKGALKSGEDLHLTERHQDVSPVLIDFDFRFSNDKNLQHRYSSEDIELICMMYLNELNKYVEFKKATLYVQEKTKARVHNNVLKDGIHIVIPDIVTRPAVQYIVRQNLLQSLAPLFRTQLGCSNDVDDIVDERVIELNNWQMYGSKKPDCEPYKVTQIYEFMDGKLVSKPVERPDEDYVEILSIANKSRETPIKEAKLEEVEAYDQQMMDERERKRQVSNATQKNKNVKKNETPYMELVEKLVGILKKERATKYDQWIRVGWCLRNIDYRLLPTWIEFSKQSDKFEDGCCERVWDYMRDDGLGIGTLHMWAKQDDERAYQEIITTDLFEILKNSLSNTHYDIAQVIHHMYQHQFVCVSVKQKVWYEFKNHRWQVSDNGYSLRMRISNEVFKEYIKAANHYNSIAISCSEDEQQVYAKRATILQGIANKLKTSSYKESLMKECADMFYLRRFEDLLDSKCHLLGFEDGVLDLDTLEFREGRPEDYISLSTGICYKEFDENSSATKDIMNFVNMVLPKEDVREYVLKVLASCMNGSIREEKFHIWTGSGSNGKSKLIELLMMSLGDYFCNMNVTALTGKRVSSNSTNSELVRTKGKRVVVLQEPGEDEKMNIGYMKELTGGDRIIARGLFKEPVEFKPQFKMILVCNHLPTVPPEDGGAWRRIRLVEYQSKFTDNPNPDVENEYAIDRDLPTKFDAWKETFMSILLEYYKKYKDEGISEPEEVTKCTKEYQKSNDVISEFIDDQIETDDTSFLTIIEIYDEFKVWIRYSNPSTKVPRRKEVQTYLEKHLGKTSKVGSRVGWKGIKLKSGYLSSEEHEDEI
jgi:P4 family phage/plasmid primase-like protien